MRSIRAACVSKRSVVVSGHFGRVAPDCFVGRTRGILGRLELGMDSLFFSFCRFPERALPFARIVGPWLV